MTVLNKYRADIDGLRGISVLSVVIFHAFPNWLAGGFLGVDVFFVISGYLITKILLNDLQTNKSALQHFYARRIRRIFPSLIVVMVFALLLGWFLLLPSEYKQLGKHIVGGAGFFSNFILIGESGYFDKASDTKILLHLWSLSIEEQFYLLYPCLLLVLNRIQLPTKPVIAAIIASSIFISISGMQLNAAVAFYSPLTRFWELLAGGILAVYEIENSPKVRRRHIANFISICALFLLSFSFLFLSKKYQVPGYISLLPVLSALALIYSGIDTNWREVKGSWVNNKILSNKVLVKFGLISYPLYLWHWVLLTYLRIIQSGDSSFLSKFIVLVISVFLSWITLIFFENPVRKLGKLRIKSLLLIMTMLAVCGYVVFKMNGFDSRYVAKNSATLTGQAGGSMGNEKPCKYYPQQNYFSCLTTKNEKIKYALIGDSKAGAVRGGLFRTSLDENGWIYYGSGEGSNQSLITGFVPVISSSEIYSKYLKETSLFPLAEIESNRDISVVVIASATRVLFQLKTDTNIDDLPNSQNFEIAHQGLTKYVSRLVKSGKKVVFLVDNPTLPSPADCVKRNTQFHSINVNIVGVNRNCNIDLKVFQIKRKPYLRLLKQLKNEFKGQVFIFDPVDIYCKNESCPAIIEGRPVYGITDHISDYTSGKIGIRLNHFVRSIDK